MYPVLTWSAHSFPMAKLIRFLVGTGNFSINIHFGWSSILEVINLNQVNKKKGENKIVLTNTSPFFLLLKRINQLKNERLAYYLVAKKMIMQYECNKTAANKFVARYSV